MQTARAALAAAQARVRQRALDVEFTRVRAPIGGRISDRRIDAGNLVSAGDDGGDLADHDQRARPDLLHLRRAGIALPEDRAQRQRRRPPATSPKSGCRTKPDYSWRGTLDFTDNGINQNSGTIRARAVVANPDYFLAPGMFGNMRLADGGTTLALLVPDAAVRTDQARKIVLIVGKDDTVAAKPVETGPLVGNLRVIRSGLTPAPTGSSSQGVQFAMPGRQGEAARHADPCRRSRRAKAPQPLRPSASQATLAAS